jgi:very-short-patch-repair endonuclease
VEVLRFIKVETQGNSGRNVNIDEIEAIRKDIEEIVNNGFNGTIGIITSFREQQQRAEEYLRKKLSNYHKLKQEQKLTIWFVGDVQGEERDVVYYTFVQDNKLNNANLTAIYPIPGGTADDIKSLKMQRLNVGFSRAKDTMVFVHSMDIEDYSDSRLGDALKFYWQIFQETKKKDYFIQDDTVFESPKEKELYNLLIQTDFYRDNRNNLRIIPQFDIGKYIAQEYQKYIPRYRVDFLMTLSDGGKEKSLILEYDGLEYHTKDPHTVKSLEGFRGEYLEYDIKRQLELESYGYHFLRINKFSLRPKAQGQTKVDVLNDLLASAFSM